MYKRKIISVFLAIVMMFSFSISVFAAGNSVADTIVETAEFDVHRYTADTNTFYIEVSVENNPELSSLSVIYDVTLGLYEKQVESDDGTFVLMSKSHIAGELALHVVMYHLSKLIGGQNEDSQYHQNYLDSKDALLNINEDRIEITTIEAVGNLIMFFGSVMDMLNN